MEGDKTCGFCLFVVFLISIHALRVEGDDAEFRIAFNTSAISIHALRVEGDQYELCRI